jgi:hypothetical protein
MRQLFLLIIILSTPFCVFGQSFTVDARVDSLDENYYKLSYSFSDTVLTYQNLENDLPFPIFMTIPEDKFTVDSTWVNGSRTEFEVFLNTEDSTHYTFISNSVLSVDSLNLEQPSLINFATFKKQSHSLILSGNYQKFYPVTKANSTATTKEVGLSALQSTYLFVFDVSVKQAQIFDSLKTSLDKFKPFYYETQQLTKLIESNVKQIHHLRSWFHENAEIYYDEIIDQTWYVQNSESPGMYEDIPFSVIGSTGDSLLFLFVDLAYSKEVDFNSVILAQLFEAPELQNIQSSIDDLYIRNTFTTSIDSESSSSVAPTQYLLNAYPNPFNPSTLIQYTLPEAGNITISVFNVLGQQVRTLAEGTRSSGAHTITFNATGLPAGMYVVRLESTGQSGKVFTETKKVMLLK